MRWAYGLIPKVRPTRRCHLPREITVSVISSSGGSRPRTPDVHIGRWTLGRKLRALQPNLHHQPTPLTWTNPSLEQRVVRTSEPQLRAKSRTYVQTTTTVPVEGGPRGPSRLPRPGRRWQTRAVRVSNHTRQHSKCNPLGWLGRPSTRAKIDPIPPMLNPSGPSAVERTGPRRPGTAIQLTDPRGSYCLILHRLFPPAGAVTHGFAVTR